MSCLFPSDKAVLNPFRRLPTRPDRGWLRAPCRSDKPSDDAGAETSFIIMATVHPVPVHYCSHSVILPSLSYSCSLPYPTLLPALRTPLRLKQTENNYRRKGRTLFTRRHYATLTLTPTTH